MNILIIAPHPDDEVLGCGGTIKKYSKQGHDVFILIMTRGTSSLYSVEKVKIVRNEALKAHQLLGIKETFFLDYPAPELDTVSIAEVSRSISKVINENKINMLFLPHRGDIHNDHTVVFKAGLVAARPVNHCPVKEILCYETLSETEWAAPFGDDAFIPTTFINISEEMNSKIEAIKFFKSQLKEFPNPRSIEAIESLAKFRGATIGFERAEAFMCIRSIIE